MIEGHPELLTDRQEQAFSLRAQGMRWADVGQVLGVSKQRAYVLANPDSHRRAKAAYKKRRSQWRRAQKEKNNT